MPGADPQPPVPTLAELQAAAAATPPGSPRPPRPQDRQEPATTDLEARVLALRDKAAQAGRLLTSQEQRAHDDRLRARKDAQQRAEEARRAIEVIEGIPTRYRAAAVTSPDVAAWVEHVQRGGTDSLVILGPTGTGKTHQSFAAFAALLRSTVRAGLWVSTPTLLDALRPGRDERVRLEDYQRTPLLLLDDLAVERGSEWTTEVLYRLLDHRYVWCLPTILTTNVPPTEVRERLGERIASRLNGMGRRVVLDGPDRRTHPGA